MQLGLHKRLEKMCVTAEEKKIIILKGCGQSSPDNSDLSQCSHPSRASKDPPHNLLLKTEQKLKNKIEKLKS